PGDNKSQAKADAPKPGEAKGNGPGNEESKKQTNVASSTPGIGDNVPTRNANGQSEPEKQGKYTDPNKKFAEKAGDLKLAELKDKVTKEMLEKYNISEEEWKRFLEAQGKREREQANAKNNAMQKDLERVRNEASRLNQGTRRVENRPDGKSGALTTDSAGKAPRDYEDAAKEFSQKLADKKQK